MKKVSGHYYPGLAQACQRLYRLTIDAIREAAQDCGYAVGLHGTLARDIDLIAAPWTEDAVPAEQLVEAIRAAAARANPAGKAFSNPPGPDPAPHGRLGWNIHLGSGVYIDLSVMPRKEGD